MNYSDYWRINKSYIPHEDLANSLRALRKVVGFLGVDREVIWTGMPVPYGTQSIELPIQICLGTPFPLPSDRMDILVGLAAHEALHVREERQHTWGYLSQMFPRMEDKTDLRRIVEAGEDLHVDGVALKMGMLGKYVQKSRAWWREGLHKDFATGLPSLEGLLGIWLDTILDGVFANLSPGELDDAMESITQMTPPTGLLLEGIDPVVETLCHGHDQGKFLIYAILVSMPLEYMDPLQLLLLRTPEIIHGGPEDRALCYRDLWTRLEPILVEWKVRMGLSEQEDSPSEIDAAAQKRHSADVQPSLPSEISEAVMTDLMEEAKDVTKDVTARIEDILTKLGGTKDRQLLFETVIKDGTEPCRTAPHQKLVRRLKDVLQLHNKSSKRISRGLPNGKLDSRRLYRAYTTGMAFKQKERCVDDTQWSVVLLLDASGSVAWCWEFLESIYAALVESLSEANAALEVIAYREKDMICELTRVYHHNALYTLFPSGATPTGEAMIAVGMMMPVGQRSLLIHLTDGLWNTGIDTWYGLEYCNRQKIDVVTIGFGSAQEALHLQYGKDFELINNMYDLPKALEALLRRKLPPRP